MNKRINTAVPKIKGMTDQEIGCWFREWLLESDHQGWEGWNSRDLSSLGRMLEDMLLYAEFAIQCEVEQFPPHAHIGPLADGVQSERRRQAAGDMDDYNHDQALLHRRANRHSRGGFTP